MKLRLGIITRNMNFIYQIEDELQVLPNIEILTFNKNERYDIILIDYDNAKDIYECMICSESFNELMTIIISEQPLLKYKQSQKLISPIFIKPDSISNKLVKLLSCITSPDSLVIKSQRSYYKIHYYDILIVYPEEHYLNFVLENETIKSRMKINDIAELLQTHGFAISNASTYVNIHRIKSVSKHEVCLDGDKHTSVSRYKYKSLIKKFKEEV